MSDYYAPLEEEELAGILLESKLNPFEEKVSWKRLDWDCSWQDAIPQVESIADILNYLSGHLETDREKYEEAEPSYDSFAVVHEDGKGICWDYAAASAALGTALGLRPLVLLVSGTHTHAAYLYAKFGRWGTLGVDCLPAMFDSISSVVKELEKRHSGKLFGKEVKFSRYAVIDLNDEFGDDWLDSEQDLYRKIFMKQASSCRV